MKKLSLFVKYLYEFTLSRIGPTTKIGAPAPGNLYAALSDPAPQH
jgi:hypothetical protein